MPVFAADRTVDLRQQRSRDLDQSNSSQIICGRHKPGQIADKHRHQRRQSMFSDRLGRHTGFPTARPPPFDRFARFTQPLDNHKIDTGKIFPGQIFGHLFGMQMMDVVVGYDNGRRKAPPSDSAIGPILVEAPGADRDFYTPFPPSQHVLFVVDGSFVTPLFFFLIKMNYSLCPIKRERDHLVDRVDSGQRPSPRAVKTQCDTRTAGQSGLHSFEQTAFFGYRPLAVLKRATGWPHGCGVEILRDRSIRDNRLPTQPHQDTIQIARPQPSRPNCPFFLSTETGQRRLTCRIIEENGRPPFAQIGLNQLTQQKIEPTVAVTWQKALRVGDLFLFG